jgi:hypothetical protein
VPLSAVQPEAKEKVGRASAANILGITVRDLNKLVETYDLSEKLTNLPDPGTSITWAREIRNLNKKLLTPTVWTPSFAGSITKKSPIQKNSEATTDFTRSSCPWRFSNGPWQH